MAYAFDKVTDLVRRADSVGRANFRAAFTRKRKSFPLLNMVSVKSFPEDKTGFEIKTKRREATHGVPELASCRSEAPIATKTVTNATIRGRASLLHLSYELCLKDCDTDMSFKDVIIENEETVAQGLIENISHGFWEGNPSHLQFGVLNHPNTQIIQSREEGEKGSSCWSMRTNNSVASEIASITRFMKRPVVVAGTDLYDDMLGATMPGARTDSTVLRETIILDLLKRRRDSKVKDLFQLHEVLNKVEALDNKPAILIYDRDAMYMTASGSIFIGAVANGTYNAKVTRQMNTAGLQIDTENSVYLLMGAS